MIRILILLILSSCSQYVQNIHRQIDREERISQKPEADQKFEGFSSQFKKKKNPFDRNQDKRPIKNPITYSLGSGPSGQLNNSSRKPRRLNADDFRDQEENASLWANQGSSASLFTYQNEKHVGDMIIINVLENLRNQISSELKRNTPDLKKSNETTTAPKSEAAATNTSTAPTSADDMDMKVYDKISGTVMEEINKDYILLRGRKEVIYKKEKKSIEIQALVSRKDIMENDYVNSDKLLESRVYVLKDYQ
jgi:flagellar L-ring protein precursor FlgH